MSDPVQASSDRRVVVAIATPLEAELVDVIRAVDHRLDVRYQPELLPVPRYPGDHRGVAAARTSEQESSWRAMVDGAEVVLGLPGESPPALADLVRTSTDLRWVHAMAAHPGEQVRAADLSEAELERVLITGSGGVQAGPLAEFTMFGLLAFARQLPRLLAGTQERHWDHYPSTELSGQTMLVVGLGSVGTQVARLAKAFGMHVLAVNRTGRPTCADVDETRPARFLGDLLQVCHAVVLALPLTDQTRGLIDARAISRMRKDAVLVNVGHGGVVDEQALIEGLTHGQPAAAVLDVFATEPLPADSPLWRMPNVLVSPHTAALSLHENTRIVELFAENLRRYLRGDRLLALVDTTHLD